MAEVVMRLNVFGFEFKRLTKTSDGLLQLAKVLERKPKVVMRIGIIRLDDQGFTVAGNGLIQLA